MTDDPHDSEAQGAEDGELTTDDAPDTSEEPDPEIMPESEGQAELVVRPLVALVELSGREDGRVTLVTGETALIGRMGDDLTLELSSDLWVSAHHARLSLREGAWWLEDVGSRNGTWLDASDTRVREPVQLEIEHVFRVGHTDLMLSNDPSLLQEGQHYL